MTNPGPDPLRPSAEAALAAWADRVRANNAQVEQFSEVPDEADFYGPIAGMFRADPRRADEPLLDVLHALARPAESWLDIGAGGGRYALPLALRAREVIALDPSAGMLGVLREGMAEHGIRNVRIVEARWPAEAPPEADLAFVAHVGYDIAEIGPFLDGMERSARRLCVAVLFGRQPTWTFDALWPAVHGVPRATLPALPEFLTLQLARGRLFELRLVTRTPQVYDSPEQALDFARRQTWVLPDSEKDRRLRALVTERLVEREGRYAFSWEPNPIGVLTWAP